MHSYICCLSELVPLPVVYSLKHGDIGIQLTPGPTQNAVLSQEGEGAGFLSCPLMAQLDLVPSNLCSS